MYDVPPVGAYVPVLPPVTTVPVVLVFWFLAFIAVVAMVVPALMPALISGIQFCKFSPLAPKPLIICTCAWFMFNQISLTFFHCRKQ